VPGPVFDPRPDPTASRLAYVRSGSLVVAALDGSTTVIAEADDEWVTWGRAEFVAAEEMGRQRGYWWAPDGERLAVARVDVSEVARWHIADPAKPWIAPHAVHYPAAGTTNASVSLHVIDRVGHQLRVDWDSSAFPYLNAVVWDGHGLLAQVQTRDQRTVRLLAIDPDTCATTIVGEDHDEAWVSLVTGTPARLGDGRLVTCADRDGARRLLIDGSPVTPAALEVHGVSHVGDDSVIFTANDLGEPSQTHVWRWADEDVVALTVDHGVHSAWAGGPTVVVQSRSLDADGATTTVLGGPAIATFADVPLIQPRVSLARMGDRSIPTALLLPRDDSGGLLPVLVDSYGGPRVQRVVASRNAFLTSQWFADQGFAVVVIDGRGTAGGGSDWERAVRMDLAGPVLDDQVAALQELAEREPRLDLSRVAIRGWSFGGFLAALAVLRRPDVFHAAIAGAPVTDWSLYDTFYTERYLGDPQINPDAYSRSSLINDAPKLERPLLLIHGLADDNVVAAHTLTLSSALFAAGRPHRVLPLSGVTHMTPQESVAENLLGLQLEFLRETLGLASSRATSHDDAGVAGEVAAQLDG
jgi:dipeptidyl-peptidase-4